MVDPPDPHVKQPRTGERQKAEPPGHRFGSRLRDQTRLTPTTGEGRRAARGLAQNPRRAQHSTTYRGDMSGNVEAPKRLNPKKNTLRELYLLSGNQCAYGGCAEPILTAEGTLHGDVAHIRGALPQSARFDPTMTNERRRAADNLLLLCKLHHADIDNRDLAEKYPVEFVEAMKATHEAKFQKAITALIGDSTLETTPTYPSTLGAFGYGPEDEEFADLHPMVCAFADRLAAIPPSTRQILALAIIHGEVRGYSGPDKDVVIDPARLREVADIPPEDVNEFIHLLEGYGVITSDSTDGYGRTLLTLAGSTPTGYGWDLYVELKDIAAGHRSVIERAVNDLDFTVFDIPSS